MDLDTEFYWLNGYLQPGERLLWSGKPKVRLVMHEEDASEFLMGLLCAGAMIIILPLWFRSDPPVFAYFFLLPFILIGLYGVLARPLWILYKMKYSRYILTNRRIVESFGRRKKSLMLKNLPPMVTVERRSGYGDIRFFDVAYGVQRIRRRFVPPVMELRNIPEVNQVVYRIKRASEAEAYGQY